MTTPLLTSDLRHRRTTSCLFASAGGIVLALWGDPSCLQLTGYVPILLVGWLTRNPHTPAAGAILSQWTVWRSVLGVVGTGLLLRLAWRTWPVQPPLSRLSGAGLRRARNLGVGVAVVCPCLYAATRIAWVLGIPVGLGREFLDQIRPIVNNGAVLAAGGLGGAVLTVGLTRPWGERFPARVPHFGGREVPVGLARNSALFVALMVAAAGCYFIRTMLTGEIIAIAPPGAADHWGAWLPEMLWPAWAAGLAVAAVTYAEGRRRGGLGSMT